MDDKDKRTTEYLTLDEKMKAVRLHEKKLEMLPDDVSKREKALLQNTKDEIEKILTWGKELLSSPDFLKAKMTDDGVSLSFNIKNTSGLDFEYIRIPFLLYDSDGQLIEQIIFQKDNWTDGKIRESQRLLTAGFPVRGSIDFKNLIYKSVQVEPAEDEEGFSGTATGINLEQFNEFMDNNSFDIVVEPKEADIQEKSTSTAEETEELNKPANKYIDKTDDTNPPVAASGKRKGIVWIILLLAVCVVIIIVAAGTVRQRTGQRTESHRQVSAEEIQKAWEDCIALSRIEYTGYDSMSKDEQLKIDSRVLLYLAERRNYFSRTPEKTYDFSEVVDSYVKHSKGGYRSDREDVVYWVTQIRSFDINNLEKDALDHKEQYAAMDLMKLMDQSDTLKEIANNAYPDEMQEGCLRIVVTSDERYELYRSRAQIDYGTFSESTVDKAKAWLTEHNVDYESSINELFDTLQTQYDEETARQENDGNDDEGSSEASSESDTDSASSSWTGTAGGGSGGGSGSSGRWKPNSGSGTGGSGTIYNSGSGSGSGSFGAGSGSTPKTNPNGWADYDEGYDDVMYNDEYDEERYETDPEYASGVDDARDEYEEVYGEEFD